MQPPTHPKIAHRQQGKTKPSFALTGLLSDMAIGYMTKKKQSTKKNQNGEPSFALPEAVI